MEPVAPLRVLIVDDHEVVREGLRLSLATDGRIEVVGLASCGKEAVVRAQRLRPEVALVDYRLPDIAGDEVCRRILDVTAGRTRVIMVTSYVSADRIRATVDAGAFGYITKADGLTALRKVLEEVLAARAPVAVEEPTPAARFLLHTLQEDLRRVEELSLTPHQRRVLELAVEGLTDRAIGEVLCITESTVRYHLQRLKARLGARSKVELVRHAYHAGLAGPTAESEARAARDHQLQQLPILPT